MNMPRYFLHRVQTVGEVVLEVPFLGGVEGEFQADEEGLLVAFEAVDGLGRDFAVEADKGFLVGVLGAEDFVFLELGAGREGVVEHEAVFEEHFVEHRVLVELDVEGVFLLADVLFEDGDVFGLGLGGIRREFHAREMRLGEGVYLEAEGVGEGSLRIAWRRVLGFVLDAGDNLLGALNRDFADLLEAGPKSDAFLVGQLGKLYKDVFPVATIGLVKLHQRLRCCSTSGKIITNNVVFFYPGNLHQSH